MSWEHADCQNADSKKRKGDWRRNQQKTFQENRSKMEEKHCDKTTTVPKEEARGGEKRSRSQVFFCLKNRHPSIHSVYVTKSGMLFLELCLFVSFFSSQVLNPFDLELELISSASKIHKIQVKIRIKNENHLHLFSIDEGQDDN